MDAALIEAFERWRRADRVMSTLDGTAIETAEQCEARTELEHARGDFLRLADAERDAHRLPSTVAALADLRQATQTLRRILQR